MIDILVRIKNSLFKSGLDQMKGQAERFKHEMSHEIGGGIKRLFGAYIVVEGIKHIIEHLARARDLGVRFGETAESMQRVNNVAEYTGQSIEYIARGMTKLWINARKATGGSKETAEQFKELGINAAKFLTLSMPDQLVELSSAYERVKNSGEGVATLVTLLGTRSADMIPMLAVGPTELRKQLDETAISSNEAAEEAKHLEHAWVKLQQGAVSWAVKGAAGVGMFASSVKALYRIVKAGPTIAGHELIEKIDEWKQFGMIGKHDPGKTPEKNPVDEELGEETKKVVALRAQIAKEAHEATLEGLDDEDKINALLRDRNALLKKANGNTEEGLTARKELIEIEKRIGDETERMIDKAEAKGKTRADRKLKAEAQLKTALAEEQEARDKTTLDRMDDEHKVKFLIDKNNKLVREAKKLETAGQREEASKKRKEALGIEDDIYGLIAKQKDARRQVPTLVSSSLAEVGGGGRSALLSSDAMRNLARESTNYLRRIADALTGTHTTRHKPARMFHRH